MSLPRRSLKERIGLVNANPPPEAQAELRVPDGDRGRQFVQDVASGIASANALLQERNLFESRCKEQEKVIANLRAVTKYHQGEAAYFRQKSEALVRANGALFATIKGIESHFGLVCQIVQQVEAEVSQMPEPEPMPLEPMPSDVELPPAGMERATAALFDATTNFIPHTNIASFSEAAAPEPTLDEIQELAARLAPPNGTAPEDEPSV